jgi:hypothetical protein
MVIHCSALLRCHLKTIKNACVVIVKKIFIHYNRNKLQSIHVDQPCPDLVTSDAIFMQNLYYSMKTLYFIWFEMFS